MRIYPQDEAYVVVLGAGDLVVKSLEELARNHGVYGFFYGVGAVKNPEIGYFDVDGKSYIRRSLRGFFEVVCIAGNIGVDMDGNVIVHAHIALGDNKFGIIGGHLFEAEVSVTLELVVIPTGKIVRAIDQKTGLKLIDSVGRV